MTHPILMITSQVRGLLYANGRLTGELASGEQLTLPVSPQGALYLEYYPLVAGYYMLARRLQFVQGFLSPGGDMHDGLYIVAWPGMLIDVQIMPERIADHGQRGSTLLRAGEYAVDIDSDAATAHIYRTGIPTYRAALPPSPRDVQCRDMQHGRLMLTGVCEQGEFLLVLDTVNARELASLRGSRIEPLEHGAIRVTRVPDDVAGHELAELWQPHADGYRLTDTSVTWSSGAPKRPSDPEDAALALVQAIKLNLLPEAAEYLTPAARSQLSSYVRLCEWGDAGIALKYAQMQRGEVGTIGLMKLLEPGYARVVALDYAAEQRADARHSGYAIDRLSRRQ